MPELGAEGSFEISVLDVSYVAADTDGGIACVDVDVQRVVLEGSQGSKEANISARTELSGLSGSTTVSPKSSYSSSSSVMASRLISDASSQLFKLRSMCTFSARVRLRRWLSKMRPWLNRRSTSTVDAVLCVINMLKLAYATYLGWRYSRMPCVPGLESGSGSVATIPKCRAHQL